MTATTPTRRPRTGRPAPAGGENPRPRRKPGALRRLNGRLRKALRDNPGVDYLMIRLVVFTLVGLGMVMALSSSMTWSIVDNSSVWGSAARQFVYVALGLVCFWLALRTPPHRLRRGAIVILAVAVLLLVAVLVPGVGTGRAEVGSQSWIPLGPFSLQPSEFAKFAVSLFGAYLLAGHAARRGVHKHRYLIFTAVSGTMAVLIMAQGDFGMGIAFTLVALIALFIAGVSPKLIVGAGAAVAAFLVVILVGGTFRSNRFHVYFDALVGRFDDTQGTAFQSYQGFLSLADGSVGGVGLGQSRAKWFYLPEANNDFIFAIVGEELGLWGGAMVIILFLLLAVFGIRTALRAADRYQAILAATLSVSTAFQAFINIGYVVGLLPVTGIQLPLMSSGGTSMIVTLAGMGVLANIARHEPEAVSAAQNYGACAFDRLLRVGAPSPADNDPAGPRRDRGGRGLERRGRDERFGAPVAGSAGARGDAARRGGEAREPRREAARAGREPGRASMAAAGRAGATVASGARPYRHGPRRRRASSPAAAGAGRRGSYPRR